MRYGHLLGGILFLLFLFCVGIFLLTPSSHQKIDVGGTSPNSSPFATTTPTVASAFYTAPQGSQSDVIVYTDAGFSPPSLTVATGTTVTFLNQSSDRFWPASDPYPSDDDYPQAGSCGSAFNACAEVAGTSWSFKFDKIGTWGYHDNINLAHRGIVIVR
jgi:plastocyanin